jgi:hypothetical protein
MRTYQFATAVRVHGLMTLAAPLLGKQEHEVEAQAPLGSTAEIAQIYARAELQAEQLAADLQDLAGEQPERHGPLMRLPDVQSGLAGARASDLDHHFAWPSLRNWYVAELEWLLVPDISKSLHGLAVTHG